MKYVLSLILCLGAASVANAHPGGGDGRSSPRPAARPAPRPQAVAPPTARTMKMNEIRGVGWVRAIDAAAGRITISYDAIEPLNWPAGTMPFAVSRRAVLDAAVVGDKVRFRLESQLITELTPF